MVVFFFSLCFIIIFIQMYCKNYTGMACHGAQQNIYHSMEVQSIMTTIIMWEDRAKATLHPSSPIAITSMELTRFCIPFFFCYFTACLYVTQLTTSTLYLISYFTSGLPLSQTSSPKGTTQKPFHLLSMHVTALFFFFLSLSLLYQQREKMRREVKENWVKRSYGTIVFSSEAGTYFADAKLVWVLDILQISAKDNKAKLWLILQYVCMCRVLLVSIYMCVICILLIMFVIKTNRHSHVCFHLSAMFFSGRTAGSWGVYKSV